MWQLTTVSNSGPKKSSAHYWQQWASDTHVVYRHTCKQNAHTRKRNFKNNKILLFFTGGREQAHSGNLEESLKYPMIGWNKILHVRLWLTLYFVTGCQFRSLPHVSCDWLAGGSSKILHVLWLDSNSLNPLVGCQQVSSCLVSGVKSIGRRCLACLSGPGLQVRPVTSIAFSWPE